MKKITNASIQQNIEKYKDIRIWAKFQLSIESFENNSKLSTFNFLFGESEGERLWHIFKLKCENNFRQFSSYLDGIQKNELLANIHYNPQMYAL